MIRKLPSMKRWRLLLSGLLLHVCAAAAENVTIPVAFAGAAPDAIPATLSRPEGPGPFPAVVLLHDCSGLGPRSSGAPGRWARELLGRGYVVLMPDSFSTRGFPDGVCTDPSPRRIEVSVFRRARDAFAALQFLRGVPNVDATHIGVMGGSHGGSSTLVTLAAAEDAHRRSGKDTEGFAAAVALYPDCTLRSKNSSAFRTLTPLLVLVGEKDDWTPAEPCRRLGEAALAERQPISVIVYPGAHHAFDSERPVRFDPRRMNPRVAGGRGATTGGDPAVWADSIVRVEAFFATHLGGK